MNAARILARETGTRPSEWKGLGAIGAAGGTKRYRNVLTGQEAAFTLHTKAVAVDAGSASSPHWGDCFRDPRMVGQSEYSTLLEHLANVADIENIAGEVDVATCITEEARDIMAASLDELILIAKGMRKRIAKLRFAPVEGDAEQICPG
jgi:hypothetical protein